MDHRPARRFPLLPAALLVVLGTLTLWGPAADAYGNACKPLVLAVLSLGGPAEDRGSLLVWNGLEVPWSRDCAGINFLLVLLAVYVFVQRESLGTRRFWLGLALTVPCAVAANVLRVLTVIAYRRVFFPAVESPQLHFFLGFLWLVPFAWLTNRLAGGTRRVSLFELLHASTALALAAPFLNTPGHSMTLAGVVLVLSQAQFRERLGGATAVATGFWLVAAAGIAWAGVESLWLPWVLLCPPAVNARWIRSPSGLAALPATCPLLALAPHGELLGWALVGFSAVWLARHPVPADGGLSAVGGSGVSRVLHGAAALALVLPFLAPALGNPGFADPEPPAGVARRELPGEGWELRLPGQPHGLGLVWYTAQGANRHHAVEVCLSYRNISLHPTDQPGVQTDGKNWYREFFLVDGRLIPEHRDYVWATTGFRKSPGIHLIFVGSETLFSAAQFSADAEATARRLDEAVRAESANR
jgi:exosortase/archaeosortase family protein